MTESPDVSEMLSLIRRLPDIEILFLLACIEREGAEGGAKALKVLKLCVEGGTVTLLPDPNVQSSEAAPS